MTEREKTDRAIVTRRESERVKKRRAATFSNDVVKNDDVLSKRFDLGGCVSASINKSNPFAQ